MRSYVFGKNEKPVFALIKSCISEDKIRPSLLYAYYDGTSLAATDGRRLVKVESKKLCESLGEEKGFFAINGSVLIEGECDKNFPDINRVMPKAEGEKFSLPFVNFEKEIKAKNRDMVVYAALCYYANLALNPMLLENVGNITQNNIYHCGDFKPIRLKGRCDAYDVTYLVMPYTGKRFQEKTLNLEKEDTINKTA